LAVFHSDALGLDQGADPMIATNEHG
jgi:hypothetical protein